MPSQIPTALVAASHKPTIEAVNNQDLLNGSESGFALIARSIVAGDLHAPANADGTAGRMIGTHYDVSIAPEARAILLSHSLKTTFADGTSGHEPIFYLSRAEIQGDIDLQPHEAPLSASDRILRIMPVLTIKQDNKELMHVTLRGPGASHAGNWGCASSLLSSDINPRSIYATLNKETGLLIDGKIAVFEPAECQNHSMNSDIRRDAERTKTLLARDVSVLKSAFNNNAGFVSLATKLALPEKHDLVRISGLMNHDVQCVAHDNSKQRTLTMIFPLTAEIPSGAILTTFNGEGYESPASLVNTKFLKQESGIILIPGLRELVMGK